MSVIDRPRPVADCSNCGRHMRIAARGKCFACYQWWKVHGEPRPHEQLPPTRYEQQPDHLTSRQVCDAVGISYRQIDYWCRSGLLAPSGGELPRENSTGFTRWWTADDVARLRSVKARLDFGLTVEAAFRTSDPGPVPPPVGGES